MSTMNDSMMYRPATRKVVSRSTNLTLRLRLAVDCSEPSYDLILLRNPRYPPSGNRIWTMKQKIRTGSDIVRRYSSFVTAPRKTAIGPNIRLGIRYVRSSGIKILMLNFPLSSADVIIKKLPNLYEQINIYNSINYIAFLCNA